MELFNKVLSDINDVIWHDIVLYVVLGVGILFTLWSGFCQFRALSHGTQVVRGKYDDPDDPGAINHFQALSAALSATVGLGNIGGVAVAIAVGGPGAVFWMWMIGLAGMALKTTEVTLSMLYRSTSDPENPHGGPMWVASKGFAEKGLPGIGKIVGGIFCITLLISAITGGNMYQAWCVATVTTDATRGQLPGVVAGIVLAVIVGAVTIGGIKRIGSVAGKLVPFMCAIYLLAAFYVLFIQFSEIPAALTLIVKSAFSSVQAEGAFIGGTFGYAFLWGMKRALFSSEAGQGSSPIAHSAARTKEPVREGVVAGLEPFIDTLVVCTLTSLVIITTGAWNRTTESSFAVMPEFVETEKGWSLGTTELPTRTDAAREVEGRWGNKQPVFMLARWGEVDKKTSTDLHPVAGETRIVEADDGSRETFIDWKVTDTKGAGKPQLVDGGLFRDYPSAALTTHAFNRVTPGLGTWLILLASWLFAISTMISWSYYGEQGMVFLLGERSVLPYKLIYCGLIVVATLGFIKTDKELDGLTALGTGVMLWANIPIMLIFGAIAMRAYHNYGRKLKAGEFKSHEARHLTDMANEDDR